MINGPPPQSWLHRAGTFASATWAAAIRLLARFGIGVWRWLIGGYFPFNFGPCWSTIMRLGKNQVFSMIALLSVAGPLASLVTAEQFHKYVDLVNQERLRVLAYFGVAVACAVSLVLSKLLLAVHCPRLIKQHIDYDQYRVWALSRLKQEDELAKYIETLDQKAAEEFDPKERDLVLDTWKIRRWEDLSTKYKEHLDGVVVEWFDQEYRKPIWRFTTAASFGIAALGMTVFALVVLPDAIHMILFGEGLETLFLDNFPSRKQ
jgi:hypothetical protein